MKHGRAGPPRPPPRTQAGHERRATIHDLPSHVLAHRVAAHLSAADAARLMQAAGHVHRGDLGHVMGQRKEEVEREAAPFVAAVRKLIAEHGRELEWHLPDGTRVEVYVYETQPFLQGIVVIRRGDNTTVLKIGLIIARSFRSPDVAEIFTTAHTDVTNNNGGDLRYVETPPEVRRLLLEVLRQLTGKRVVTTWVKDAKYKFGIGSLVVHEDRDESREKRLVQEKMKANPGASVVLLTGHLKR